MFKLTDNLNFRGKKMKYEGYLLSQHAQNRMFSRRISHEVLQTVLKGGRRLYKQGACFFFIGDRELKRSHNDPRIQKAHGIHVLVEENVIVTVYRNRSVRNISRPRPKRR